MKTSRRACQPEGLDLVSGSQPRAALGVVNPSRGGWGIGRYLWMAGEDKRGEGQREREGNKTQVESPMECSSQGPRWMVGWWGREEGTIDSFDDCGQQNKEGAAVR
jgi:hypothetical protein